MGRSEMTFNLRHEAKGGLKLINGYQARSLGGYGGTNSAPSSKKFFNLLRFFREKIQKNSGGT